VRRYSPIRRFRAWMDLGRAQGVSTTAAIAIIGALTSDARLDFFSPSPEAFDILDCTGFVLISIFTHMVPNAYIELGDLPLDSLIKESSRKPIVSGVLKPDEVMWFVRYGLIASWVLYAVFFTSLPALAFLALSALWVMWYGCGYGKRIPGSYDFAFSFAYGFYTLFGVYAVGSPTMYTWLFLGVVVTAGTAFAQWENSLKDVDADRAAGVRSFAVLLGVRGEEPLSPGHPFMLYGYLLKGVFLAVCFCTYIYMQATSNPLALPYLLFFLFYSIPSQVFLMYRFLRYRKRLDIRRTILLDVPLTAFAGFAVVVGKTGFEALIWLMVFLIGGYLVGSKLQYGTEFKFGRYDEKWERRLQEEP